MVDVRISSRGPSSLLALSYRDIRGSFFWGGIGEGKFDCLLGEVGWDFFPFLFSLFKRG
jgi:hypothetical protein